MLISKSRIGRGFTLIEAIVYLTIVGFMIVGVINLNIMLQQSRSKFTAQRRSHYDANLFLNNLDFLLKNSTSLVTDSTGAECQDFEGAQGYNSYYLALYFNTSSAATALPYECRGDYNATTTAVKVYWRSSTHRGLWIDCYKGFINGNSGNCTTMQSYGDASYMMTADKNSAVYDGGLVFATSTSYGNPALKVQLAVGIPNTSGLSYASATTTASTTINFRYKITNAPQPTEAVCGDSNQVGSEVCDSSLASACSQNGNYYSGAYDEDGSTCSGRYGCNNTCSACLTQLACTGSCGTGGYLSGGYCYYLGAADQTCTTVCATHAGCVAGALSDTACAIMIDRGANCSTCEAVSSGKYSPSSDGTATCYVTASGGYSCSVAPPAGYKRLCRCAS